ncbi:MAG: shikimate dehydrogenase [Lentisphaeria bacterium]|jgi:shikimate dehydrogenase
MTQRYAVLGFPVGHSLSPCMHNAAFAALGLDAAYEAIEVAPAELPAVFARLRREGYGGWNCTVPHKEAAATLVDEVAPEARRIGSVNTVVCRDGRLTGHSTDGYGLLAAAREAFAFAPPGARVAIVGCGGAGRAAAFALAGAGVARLLLLNRTPERAAELARELACHEPRCQVAAAGLADAAALAAALAGIELLVQATSLGLKPGDPAPLPAAAIPAGCAVLDMIYRDTPLLRAAAAHGCRTADGLGMLLHQGARSFRLWTGREAPLEIMRAALLRERAARQAAAATAPGTR